MLNKISKPISTAQSTTAHIIRRDEGLRYRIWFGAHEVGQERSLSKARIVAGKTKATELTECWETGKAYERTKRGAWKLVKNTD